MKRWGEFTIGISRAEWALFARALAAPGGVLLAAAIVAPQWEAAREWLTPLVSVFTYLVFGAGFLLSWMFNRGRVFYTVLVLALVYWALPAILAAEVAGGLMQQELAFLIPLNLLGFSLAEERGIFTPYGLARAGTVGLQAGIVFLFSRYGITGAAEFFLYEIVSRELGGWTWMGQPTIVVFAGVWVYFAVAFFRHRNVIDRGFFWALPAIFWGLNTAGNTATSAYAFGTAGVILVVALVEYSHAVAYRDELTGLPGRRALNEELAKLGDLYAVAMVDVDHFKDFNDSYGHDAGDQVLRLVATKLGNVHGGGRAFRYGGEEFTVLFPNISREEARPYLELLRMEIERTKFHIRGSARPRRKPEKPLPRRDRIGTVSLTVSIGLAELDHANLDPNEVLEAADRALYRAKRGGRNQVRS